MNGPHDLGGRMGFGAIAPETDEPLFHADWEKRALGLTLCAARPGGWTIDESRHMRESLHPADYYTSSYYEIWIKALERLLLSRGLIASEELAGGQVERVASDRPMLKAEEVPAMLARGGPTARAVEVGPRFGVGDRVRARNIHPHGHTRLPGYAKGKLGRIVALHGGHVFPDTNAHGRGEAPQHLYTVVFAARELWGADGDARGEVTIDAWESYLEPA